MAGDVTERVWETPSSVVQGGQRVELIVAGELWESAAVERTRHSLHVEGVEARGYRAPFGRETKPLKYADVVDRLVAKCEGERILLVPAGMATVQGFGEALQRWCEEPFEVGKPLEVTGKRRVLAALRPTEAGGEVLWGEVGEELAGMLVDLGLHDGEVTGAVQYRKGVALRKPEGADTFQRLSGLGLGARLEAPIWLPDRPELEAARDGWVYRCNNELLRPDLSAAVGCDALVAVAAGIKPWHFANDLRKTLRRVVVIDSQMAQLGFAYRAFQGVEQARSWRELCDGSPYRSDKDEHLHGAHDRLFRRIRRGRGEWKFEVEFVLADIVSQTLGLVEHLKRKGIVRPVFWYSNIFQPYVGEGLAEHHAGLEYSFVTLIRREFPGAVLFASGRKPVVNPLVKTDYPGFLFRSRRFLSRKLF
jgi:hypothetical protein